MVIHHLAAMRGTVLFFAPVALVLLSASVPGFQPGLWKADPISNIGQAKRMCLRSIDQLLTGGRGGGGCTFTPIRSDATQTIVTWRCADGASGRTQLRRDAANVYTIHTQGVDGGLPFMEHAEWRRTGECAGR